MSALELQALGGRPLAVTASEIALNRWMSAVGLAIICYDTILTLPEEIQFLWPKKWSDVKALTYLNRFISFFFIIINAYMFNSAGHSLSNSFCEVLVTSTGIGAYVCFAMSNWILLARARALLGDRRMFRYCLLALYVILYLGTAGMVIKTSRELKGQFFYSKALRICSLAHRPVDMGAVWVGPMIFETTIFIITLIKLYQNASRTYALGSKLIMVLYRDGICYYLIIIVLRILTFISWIVFPLSLLFITFFVLWAVMSIAITRLQINLREAAIELEPLLNNVQATPPPPESREEGRSVIFIRETNRHGIYTLTPDIQSRSMASPHHGPPIDHDSHRVQVQTAPVARAPTFRGDGEYRGVEESEVSTRIHPNEGIVVARSANRVVPMGPRALVTMNKGLPIATGHIWSGSFHRDHNSIV
ncbi:hypothetical protein CPB86DRAFT_423997 [Serendipita vermifera]|nr:hypothetical protein CPB86DRAFT_423997 [Serendipita vermifera]